MKSTWIVCANAGRARVFAQADAAASLEEINDMTNAAVHLRTVDTETDGLGLRSASKSQHGSGAPTQPSGYEPHQTPAEHQTELFARDLNQFLLTAHQEGRYSQLVLVASPEFLGVLRQLLSPQLTSLVSSEINKDYTHFNAEQLRKQIQTHTNKDKAERQA